MAVGARCDIQFSSTRCCVNLLKADLGPSIVVTDVNDTKRNIFSVSLYYVETYLGVFYRTALDLVRSVQAEEAINVGRWWSVRNLILK